MQGGDKSKWMDEFRDVQNSNVDILYSASTTLATSSSLLLRIIDCGTLAGVARSV
jgi:hypothetical protein